MPQSIPDINWNDAITNAPGYCIVDVRSPAEYALGHIPGAVSIPVLDNQERAEIGTLYKHQGREQAIRRGFQILGLQMNSKMQLLITLKPKTASTILVYCWRGGLRSAIMAWLFSLCGFKVLRLSGGYKQYRQQVLQNLAKPRNYIVLAGFTGSGKTELLQYIATCGENVIDLEHLAAHKGSAFGNLNFIPQPTQQQFENTLAMQLANCDTRNEASKIWLESESQRIGTLNIPQIFFNIMIAAPLVNWIRPFNDRLNRIVSEYGLYSNRQLEQAVIRMSKRLGGLDTQRVLEHLKQSDVQAAFSILLHYYDRWYLKSRHADVKNQRKVWVYESSESNYANIYKSLTSLIDERSN